MIDRFRVQSLVIDAAKRLLTANLHAGDEGDAAGDASGRSDPFAGAEVIDVASVFSQMGVIVRPVIARTLRALGLRDGDDVLVLKLWDRARTPIDVEEGETRVYACGDLTAKVRLRQTGISIEAKGATITITNGGAIQLTPASGQDVVLNGGGAKVARLGDAVSAAGTLPGTMGGWITQVTAAVNGLAPGSVTAIAGNSFGTVAAGANNVKA